MTGAMVVEVKRTLHGNYARQGFDEAALYRWEYQRWLTGWPKAVLVTTGT